MDPASGQGITHILIANKYAAWERETEERFKTLKRNEEELNRIFIDIYGLQDELPPGVADKDMTVLYEKTEFVLKFLEFVIGICKQRSALNMAIISLVSGKGFVPTFIVEVTNGFYFNIDQPRKTFKGNGKHEYIVSNANDDGKPIKESDKLIFTLPTFDTIEEATQAASEFLLNIRLFLTNKGFAYSRITPHIKDLSKIEFGIAFSGSATLSALISFDYFEMISHPFDAKVIDEIIKIFEKANIVNDTMLEFMLYMIAIESLSPQENRSGKTEESVCKLIEIADSLDYENNDKDSIIGTLKSLYKTGARNSVLKMLNKFGLADKTLLIDGNPQKYKAVFSECYTIRSNFVHSNLYSSETNKYLQPLKQIAYDALNKYNETGSR